MGQSVPLFLTRAAAFVLAGLLLFAAFGNAHAAGTENYGLKRFSGDNYDTLPARPQAPTPQTFAPVPGSQAAPNGYYTTLNSGAQPAVTVSPPPVAQSQPYQPPQGYAPAPSYQPAPVSNQPYGYSLPPGTVAAAPAYQPAPVSNDYGYRPPSGTAAAAPVYQPQPMPEAYGYKPSLPSATAYPSPRLASASPMRGDPYAYYQQDTGNRGDNADYVLGPGDKMRLNVFGETDLSGDFTIDGSGYVRLPLIGQVRAAGYTSPQLEAAIGSALSQGYLKSPRVAVEVSTYRPFYIIGAVNRPGQYPYVDHMNAMNAVALAGGFTPSAVESVVFIRREGSNKEDEVPVDRTTTIRPGDVVKVHNTIFSEAVGFLSPFSGVAASAATAAVLH
jgi:protein involved in polysaccharide export with SLBB domain